MTTHDDFAANEQLAHTELSAVMRAIRKGTLDFTRPIHVPTHNSHEDVTGISAKVPTHIIASLDELHGNGRKYRNRTQVIVQALCMLLMYESLTDEERGLDPAVIKADQDREDAERAIIDDTVKACEKLINPKSSSATLNRMLSRLEGLKTVCEQRDYDEQLRSVEYAINGAHFFSLRSQVDDAVNEHH